MEASVARPGYPSARWGILADEVCRGMLSAGGATVSGGEGPPELGVWELGEQVRKGGMGRLVRVRGVVVQVSAVWTAREGNRTPYVYGELRDDGQGAGMAFRCRAEEAVPHAGERVVLEGRVEIAFHRDLKRFELRLRGEWVGTWGEDVSLAELTPTLQRRASLVERSRARVGVSKLVHETQGRVVLIGTRTGMNDVQRAAARVGSRVVFDTVVTRVFRWQEILEAVRGAAGRCDAVCLVRGGGDPEDFACWNEPELVRGLLESGRPVYTGLGHSDYELTLADLRADESFGTPAEFGAAYATAWREAKAALTERGEAERQIREQRRHVETLESLVAAEQRSREVLAGELREAVARREVLWKRTKVLLWVCGVLLLVIAGMWVWG